jgi:hypothetical protein
VWLFFGFKRKDVFFLELCVYLILVYHLLCSFWHESHGDVFLLICLVDMYVSLFFLP